MPENVTAGGCCEESILTELMHSTCAFLCSEVFEVYPEILKNPGFWAETGQIVFQE